MLDLTPDELLTTTRTVRRRLDLTRDVAPDLIAECLRIATQAPSGSNRQGWRFLVITDPDLRAGIAERYRASYAEYRSLGSATQIGGDDADWRATRWAQHAAEHPPTQEEAR